MNINMNVNGTGNAAQHRTDLGNLGNAALGRSMPGNHESSSGSGFTGDGQKELGLGGVDVDGDRGGEEFAAQGEGFRNDNSSVDQHNDSGFLQLNTQETDADSSQLDQGESSVATTGYGPGAGSSSGVAAHENGFMNGHGQASDPGLIKSEGPVNGLSSDTNSHAVNRVASGHGNSSGGGSKVVNGAGSGSVASGGQTDEDEWMTSQTSEGRRFWYSRKTRESHWYNPVIVMRGAEKIRNEEVVDHETIKHLQLFQAEKRMLKEKTEKANREARKEAAAEAKKAKQKAEALKRKAAEVARKQALEAARLKRERQAAAELEKREREREKRERERLASFAKAKYLLRRYLDSIGYESMYASDKMIDDAILYVRPTHRDDKCIALFEAQVRAAQVPFTSSVPEDEKRVQSDYVAQKKIEQERAMNSEFFGIDEKSLTAEQLAVKEEFIKFFSVKSKTKSAEQDAELTRKRLERKKKLQEKAAVLRASSTRPKRRGKSRLVNVDGHMILKENNYDMDEGIKTIGKVVSTVKKIRAARSAFNFYSTKTGAQLRKDFPNIEFREVQREVAARWRLITPEERVEFDEMAANDRIRYAQEVAETAAEEETKRREAERKEAERKSKGSGGEGCVEPVQRGSICPCYRCRWISFSAAKFWRDNWEEQRAAATDILSHDRRRGDLPRRPGRGELSAGSRVAISFILGQAVSRALQAGLRPKVAGKSATQSDESRGS